MNLPHQIGVTICWEDQRTRILTHAFAPFRETPAVLQDDLPTLGDPLDRSVWTPLVRDLLQHPDLIAFLEQLMSNHSEFMPFLLTLD